MDDIREEVDTFMFEGHDTTSVALSWTCYLLGKNPEIQDKAFKELSEVFGTSDRLATDDDLKRLTYLECIIKESLRLYPPVPYFARTLTSNVNLDKYVIPKGTVTIIMLYILHTDKKQFKDPFKFCPERFLDNDEKRHTHAYIPFSAGPRNCIGQKFAMMEEKIILSSILRKFRIETLTKDIIPSGEIVLRAADKVLIKLFNR